MNYSLFTQQILLINTVSVEEYVYEKVKKSDVLINIPKEPIYFQEHNHKIVIGLFPQYNIWADVSTIYDIHIVKITNKTVEKATIRPDAIYLSYIISKFDVKGKSQEDYLKDKAVKYLKDHFTEDRISKEVFIANYEDTCKQFSSLIN